MRMATTMFAGMSEAEYKEVKEELLETLICNLYDEIEGAEEYKELYHDYMAYNDNNNAQLFLTMAKQELEHAHHLCTCIDALVPAEEMKELLENPFAHYHVKMMNKKKALKEELATLR